ncbi:MAG: NTP transferase domain-containing protein, partial [Thermoanaerobaculia bacterium]
MPLTCILLAAGSSSRLGRPKQLVTFRGRPLIRHAAETAIGAGVSKLVVIVPADSPDIVAALDGLELETIENPDAAEGIASSIRLGVGRTAGPWLLLLC